MRRSKDARGLDLTDVATSGSPLDRSIRALDFVRRTLDPAILLGRGLVGALAGFAREGEPLLRSGWSALDAPDASA